ncbi:MAG: MFS transporter [Nocardioidaceae bacterium]
MASTDTTDAAPMPEVPPSTLRRAVAASAIGNATEWFDYGLYAYGVTYISAALFPGSAEEATLSALATFAISFLVRPLGGLVWGPLGDRLGRKSVLAMTIVLMSGATFCVGLLPTYDAIGFWAPTLLIIFRMVQGFSTGGEYGGAATFMAEYSPDKKRGFYGSFLEFGTLAGFSAAALLMLGFSLALSDGAMNSWGWRVPFLIAGPLGVVGLYLRSRMEDTPIFRELEDADAVEEDTKTQFKDLVTQYWKPMLTLGGLVVALNVVNYTLLAYMPTYLETEIGLSSDASLIAPIIGQLAMMVLLPFAGLFPTASDASRCGGPRWPACFVLAIPMYLVMATSPVGAVIGFAVLGLLYVPQLATISATFPAMFPTHVRFAGLAIAYNVSTSLFGGTAPLVNDCADRRDRQQPGARLLHDGRVRRGRCRPSLRDRDGWVLAAWPGRSRVISRPAGRRPGAGRSRSTDA